MPSEIPRISAPISSKYRAKSSGWQVKYTRRFPWGEDVPLVLYRNTRQPPSFLTDTGFLRPGQALASRAATSAGVNLYSVSQNWQEI